ncbi:MAG: hypothetical protein DRN30_06055 [Thermoplasmata archaeon]|nr:MAG: hypothetical protein DRN30_06055 [Thermoplasmata archaeon]
MIYEVIGTIYRPTGNMLTDSEGNEYPEMEPVEGYHVNALDLTDEDRQKLEPYIIQPETPYCVFAGREKDTVFLRFNSREEWLSLGYEKVEEEL